MGWPLGKDECRQTSKESRGGKSSRMQEKGKATAEMARLREEVYEKIGEDERWRGARRRPDMDDTKSDDDTPVKSSTLDDVKRSETVKMDDDKSNEAVKMDEDNSSDAMKMEEDKSNEAVKIDEYNSNEAVMVDESKIVAAETGDNTDTSVPVTGSPTAQTGSPTTQTGSPTTRKKKSGKVDILLKATGGAPIMKKAKWSVETSKTMSWIIDFLRRYIKCEQQQSIFVYVNQSFAPSLDVSVGVLYECFGSDGKLILHYCMTQAWG
ncbi:Ubiquitin-like protein ATG12 [Lamellibrachia satsuma]|nr:Ubiquitin-like protein ATG12 [Lamellibrachia satsuma]